MGVTTRLPVLIAVCAVLAAGWQVATAEDPVVIFTKADGTHLFADPEADRVVQWFKANGGFIHPDVVPAIGPRGRGLFALREMKRGEPYVGFPQSLVLEKEAVFRGPLGRDLQACGANVTDTDELVLAVALVEAKHDPNNRWHAYATTLPQQVDTPVGFSATEMEDLAGCHEMQLIAGNYRSLGWEQYDLLNSTLLTTFPDRYPRSVFTKDEFMWGLSMVMSRGFSRKRNNLARKTGTKWMVPVDDLVNHDPTILERVLDNPEVAVPVEPIEQCMDDVCAGVHEEACYCSPVMDDTAAGEEIFIWYVEGGQNVLFSQYGFVDERAELPKIHARIYPRTWLDSLSIHEEEAQLYGSYLAHHFGATRAFKRFELLDNGAPSSDLMQIARLWAIRTVQEVELSCFRDIEHNIVHINDDNVADRTIEETCISVFKRPLNAHNEVRALWLVLRNIRRRVRDFGPLDATPKNAMSYRRMISAQFREWVLVQLRTAERTLTALVVTLVSDCFGATGNLETCLPPS